MKPIRSLLLMMLFASSISNPAFAAGGDRIDNGGGLAEKNVLLAYSNLDRYVQTCLNIEGCRLTESERDLLGQIVAALPSEQATTEQVIFKSERANPGFFRIRGEMKMAKTGSAVGSPIYVNLDLLYTRNALGVYEPLSLVDAVAMLVHEFGHHHGEVDHTALDVLGLKVASQLRRVTYVTPLLPLQEQVALHVFNGTDARPQPETLLYMRDEVIDLTQQIRDAIRCVAVTLPISIGPIPPISIPSRRPYGVLLHNLHWRDIDDHSSSTSFEIRGTITMDCDKKGIKKAESDYELRIRFTAAKKKTESGLKWTYNPESLQITQARDSWLGILSFFN